MIVNTPPEPIDELNWSEFVQFASVDMGAPELKHSDLLRIWRNYDANMDRIRHMLMVVALSGEIRQIVQNCSDIARFRVTGSLWFLEKQEENEEIDITFKSLLNENIALIASRLNALRTGNDEQDKRIDQQMALQILNRDALITRTFQNDKNFRVGLEHFIETSITTGWTAFEVFSTDLWEAALNIHPKGLASLNANSKSLNKIKSRNSGYADGDIGDNKQKRGEDRTILLRKLHENDYDIKNRMGSILKYKYAFNTLWSIRRAYFEAFGDNAKQLEDLLMHKVFDQLSSLRNVIVHNSCLCDADYIKDQADIIELPRADKGFKVKINGAYASSLMLTKQACCKLLIQSIDDWLHEN
ncbi:MAG: hypothetical protein WAK01_16250 [Methylocystis sp.]